MAAKKKNSSEHPYHDYKPIEDYGVIGDLHTVALVGLDGSIDWCCLPHFNSPSVFSAILDARKGGYFKISPVNETIQKQMYLPETCVLVTRFLSPEGIAEVVDYMSIEEGGEDRHRHQIIRTVRGVQGAFDFRMECYPVFDYARKIPSIHKRKSEWLFRSGKDEIVLAASKKIGIQREGSGLVADFRVKDCEEITFVFRHESEKEEDGHHAEDDPQKAFKRTVSFWRRWVTGIQYEGRWREMVQRSAMTLKLLTFDPTGAIVAAPTMGLPETLGGTRNFDYRCTWIRDAAFTVYAFLRLGLTCEAEKFMQWIDARAHEREKDGALQIMYGIDGRHELKEIELSHLEGYQHSRPVRLGNAAYDQLQLDIYGELMDAIYLSNKYSRPISYDLWKNLRYFLDYVCKNWKRKDEGIWEIRAERQHFVYSKLMCWVALDRGIRLADKRSFPSDRDRWRLERDKIYEDIMEKGWNAKRSHFVQHYETTSLDASNLIMPLVFFISPSDPRMQKTLDATLKHLTYDSLVYRYDRRTAARDGFEGAEGTFSMCSFWLVEALTRAGRLEEARLKFEKMLSYANHLGLYSEEIGPSGEALGNFPQAFTHMSLISAAYNLDRRLGKKATRCA